MKRYLAYAMLPLLMLALTSSQAPTQHSAHHSDATTYSCPMHEDVTAAEPGTCAVCGMALIAGSERTRVGILQSR